jgi:Fe-Mn family superoxide dismutase
MATTHTLPQLPYAQDALEPHISARTLEFHHGKHHQAYVTNLNNLIPGTPFENATLEETMLESHGKSEFAGIFNNAAQVWNHTFFWYSMKPNGGGEPQGTLAELINSSFGSLDAFKAAFKQAATTQFGSGWAWLVESNGKLEIIKTANAELPQTQGKKPLLTCDVWEHAYYLDFQNRRPDYVDTFLNHLVNWEFAAANLI